MLWQWILRIALWTLAGYLGSQIMKDSKPNGFLGNVVLGWIGGLIGNFAFRRTQKMQGKAFGLSRTYAF